MDGSRNHCAQHFGAIHHRHHVIEEHQIRMVLSLLPQAPLSSIRSGQHAISFVREDGVDQFGNARFIIHHENQFPVTRRLCPSRNLIGGKVGCLPFGVE